jgi:ferrochelatase
MQLIKPDVSRLENDVEGYSIFDTLFKTTFKVGGYVYQEMELAPFHLEYLLRVVDFCKKEDLPYKIDKIRYTKHFMPVFINAHLAPVPAGKSDKVAIFVDNIPDIVKAREYIRHSNDWIKGIVLTPPQTKVDGIDRPYWFKTEEEAKEILKNTLYNYAFIYSSDKSILRNMKEEYSLF